MIMVKGKEDFCPFCKRDMHPGEPPFDLEHDNHVDRCIKASKVPLYYKQEQAKLTADFAYKEMMNKRIY